MDRVVFSLKMGNRSPLTSLSEITEVSICRQQKRGQPSLGNSYEDLKPRTLKAAALLQCTNSYSLLRTIIYNGFSILIMRSLGICLNLALLCKQQMQLIISEA